MDSTSQRHRKDKSRAAERGYTLLELLVVMAILGLLAGLVAPRVIKYLSSSKSGAAYLQTRNLSSALDLYRLDVGRYPSRDEGLEALVHKPKASDQWSGPYLNNESGIVDPWGRKFVYRIPGQHGEFDILSYGADGAEGGEGEDADVHGWEKR